MFTIYAEVALKRQTQQGSLTPLFILVLLQEPQWWLRVEHLPHD